VPQATLCQKGTCGKGGESRVSYIAHDILCFLSPSADGGIKAQVADWNNRAKKQWE